LDKYKIEKVIDTHRNVDIYLATDIEFNNTVIIKLIKQPREKEIEELKREFNFLKVLYNTGVTPAPYDLIQKTDFAYFTQEFIDGLSLPKFISKRKSSSKKLVMSVIGGIISAFAKVHAANIVHGDVHPSNIIIMNGAKIKVIDFGFAIHQELEKDELVNYGGVYFYMPPERIGKTTRNKFTRKPDFCSDVFQLGVVLYVLLYDEYPFKGITWEELAAEIKAKQIEFPATSQYGFLVPEWLITMIKKCVAKRPSRRFANAQELSQAFSKKQVIDASKIRSAVKI
jgi:serine/threonine protein kinase